jgi:uncharacterized Fe-S radical SAM superfamily protein PflX
MGMKIALAGLDGGRIGIAAHHQANLVIRLLVTPDKVRDETEDILDKPI